LQTLYNVLSRNDKGALMGVKYSAGS